MPLLTGFADRSFPIRSIDLFPPLWGKDQTQLSKSVCFPLLIILFALIQDMTGSSSFPSLSQNREGGGEMMESVNGFYPYFLFIDKSRSMTTSVVRFD